MQRPHRVITTGEELHAGILKSLQCLESVIAAHARQEKHYDALIDLGTHAPGELRQAFLGQARARDLCHENIQACQFILIYAFGVDFERDAARDDGFSGGSLTTLGFRRELRAFLADRDVPFMTPLFPDGDDEESSGN